MNPKSLQSQIALGEDSQRRFKVDVRNAESPAAEMAAFAVFQLKLRAEANP